MAVKVQHICDNPEHGGIDVEGAPVPVGVGNIEGLLDLCEECRSSLVQPLIELLIEYGRTEDGRAVRPGRRAAGTPTSVPATDASHLLPRGVPMEELQRRADEGYCPLDPACQQLKSRQSVAMHVRSTHGVVGGLDALGMSKRGINQPVRTKSTDDLTCQDCDPPRTFDRAQGIAVHRSRVHNIGKGGRKRAA